MPSARGLVLSLLAVVGVSACGAGAAQWVVAQDGSGSFRSIQGALDAASYGDVIYVSPGTYNERIVLKDGVRVVGAGADRTTVRHAYGFDEVVRIQHMAAGSLERVTIERLASVLPGPVVAADSAAAALIECRVLGGQGAGVLTTGAVCTLTLDRVTISGNVGYGVHVCDGARLAATACQIGDNSASGLVVDGGSTARLSASTLADNGRCGAALEATASLTLEACALRDNGEWGLLAPAHSTVVVSRTVCANNAAGGLSLAGDARLTDVDVEGGAEGIAAGGDARVEVVDVRVRNVAGDGVRASGRAALSATGLFVDGAAQSGVVVEGQGDVRIVRSTVTDCGGDGVALRAGPASVTQSVLAYNRGAGVRVDAASMAWSPELGDNLVWGNGTDYVGVARPATDLAHPPSVAERDGRPVLLPGSPCRDAGPSFGPIGAGSDAEAMSTVSVTLTPMWDGWLGATWRSTLRAGGPPLGLETLGVGCEWASAGGTLDVDVTLLGTWGPRAAADGEGGLAWRSAGSDETASLAYGGAARWEAGHGWADGWLTGAYDGGGLHVDGRVARVWPHGPWTADLAFGLAEPLPLRVAVGTVGTTLRRLSLTGAVSAAAAGSALRLDGSVSLLPRLEVSADLTWTRGAQAGDARATFRPAEGALLLSLGLGDARARLEGRALLVAAAPVSGEVSLVVGGRPLRATASVALDASGPRIRAGLEIVFGSTRDAPNIPPVPAFRTTPPDPEVGKPIRFLADESTDPDGQLAEIWWDFGDGDVAEGVAVEHAFAAPGDYDVVLTVSDDRGAAASRTQSVRVWPADTAPIATFFGQPVSPGGARLPRPLRAGDLVGLDASASSDRDGKIVEYAWDIGADGTFDVVSADSVATVGPFEAGPLPVTLRTVDDAGRSDAVMQVLVIDKSEPPLAAFTFAPSTPAVRDPIRFTDRSTDTDGAIVAREWDFGDGTTSREASPTHRYDSVGRYTVLLHVIDDDQLSATASRSVDVTAVPGIADVDGVWAVLIGISDYAEVRDLQYASDDALAMARWFLDAGVPADHLRVLLDRDGPQDGLDGLEARRATLVNVREALGWLRRVARPNDLVVIHFSGHGVQGDDDDGDEKDGLDEFFVLWDTRSGAEEDTALRDDEFGAALDRIDCEHVVVFFDGCYSGGLSRSLEGPGPTTSGQSDLFTDFSVEGRIVFSASAESQDAFESDELRHGIFTYYILDGLAGSADANGDRRITAWELYEHVARQVPARALRERGARQDPQLLGEGDARVLLAEAPPPPAADFGYRPTVPYAGGPVAFVDQSGGGRRITHRTWTFGDGATAADAAPVHAYTDPGAYTVELRVAREDGTESVARQVVAVDAPATVTGVDPTSGLLVLSVGHDQGVAVGDRFAAAELDGSAESLIEVVESVDARTSVGRLVHGPQPAIGARLVPVAAD